MSLQESFRKDRREWDTVATNIIKRVKAKRKVAFARLNQATEEKLYILSHPEEFRDGKN